MLKIGWWTLCLTILAAWYFISGINGAAAPTAASDWRSFVLAMAVISFPAGPLWLWALPSIRDVLPATGVDLSLLPWYWEQVAAWFGITVIGYAQWFWLLPAVFRLRADD